jgi:hypothetical protein
MAFDRFRGADYAFKSGSDLRERMAKREAENPKFELTIGQSRRALIRAERAAGCCRRLG